MRRIYAEFSKEIPSIAIIIIEWGTRKYDEPQWNTDSVGGKRRNKFLCVISKRWIIVEKSGCAYDETNIRFAFSHAKGCFEGWNHHNNTLLAVSYALRRRDFHLKAQIYWEKVTGSISLAYCIRVSPLVELKASPVNEWEGNTKEASGTRKTWFPRDVVEEKVVRAASQFTLTLIPSSIFCQQACFWEIDSKCRK